MNTAARPPLVTSVAPVPGALRQAGLRLSSQVLKLARSVVGK